jgi:hypothetical protein
MSALEHLDALGTNSTALHALAEPPIDPTNAAAVAQRNPDADDTSSNRTFASSGQHLLLEMHNDGYFRQSAWRVGVRL